MLCKSTRTVLRAGIAILAMTVATLASSAPQFHGAIYTSVADGTTVNANLYDAKADVYLNGGPQNLHAAGLPDGTYYFQITNPNGAVLLSTDPVVCRQLSVVNGAVNGATGPSCKHADGIFNNANGSMPVQMIPFLDTPNNGGEYKAFLVSQDASIGCGPDKVFAATDGIGLTFPSSCAKTDNFKVRKPLDANIVDCKFNDLNGNGAQDAGEPTIAGWPITATGVADSNGLPNQTVATVTGADGCVAFTVPAASNVPVTLTEGTDANWYQTAPADGSYPASGSSPVYAVTGGVVSTVINGGQVLDIDFGNRKALRVSKTARPSYKINWSIAKNVDNTEIKRSTSSAVFNYTVNVSHDAGSDFKVTGIITLYNDSPAAISGVNVGDTVDNGATSCVVTGGTGVTVPANGNIAVPYVCTYTSLPAAGTNTATATWGVGGSSSGTAAVDFSATVPSDSSVTVTDTLGGSLGTVNYTDASPKQFTYPITVTSTAGTCVSKDNTATFTTNTSATTRSASKSVSLCVGADLTVTKTANAAFTSVVAKGVDKTLVQQVSGGTATFTYTVNVTTSGWTVFGNITVANPNDWQSITANVSDALSDAGGVCTVSGGASVAVAASSSATLPYTCSFASAPGANSGTNTATATWDGSAATGAATPNSSGAGSANYGFTAVTVKDTFNGGAPDVLGSVNAAPDTASYTYTHTVPVPLFNCQPYANLAAIDGGNSAPLVTVNVCGPAKTGALTKGFWQNKNGQGIILGGASTLGVCNSGTWLRQFLPYQDLSATATCSGVASYVMTIIKAADSAGTSMNPMLKAQMLATSLDVYFSDPALGLNKINSPAPIGSKNIDLTKICKDIGACTNYENVSSVFGPANNLTVYQMLLFAGSAPQSNYAGTNWYGQVKATQELAKDAFDAINNEKVFSP